MKESGWIIDKSISIKIRLYKFGELNGSSYVNFPLRSFALLNNKNDDKFCLIWSILAKLYPCENDHPSRLSNYRQNFDELNIEGFDFRNRFRCSDVHNFEKLINLYVNINELNFYHDKNKWKHNLFPIEIS